MNVKDQDREHVKYKVSIFQFLEHWLIEQQRMTLEAVKYVIPSNGLDNTVI